MKFFFQSPFQRFSILQSNWFINDRTLSLEILKEVLNGFREIFRLIGRRLSRSVTTRALLHKVLILMKKLVDDNFSKFFIFGHLNTVIGLYNFDFWLNKVQNLNSKL